MIRRFLNDESGATAIEYALIAGLIFLAIVGAIIPIGASLSETFDEASAGLN
jgi:pilus assembly protein Flp/PilA